MQRKDFMFEAMSFAPEKYLLKSENRHKVRVKTVKKRSAAKTVATISTIILASVIFGVAGDNWVLKKYREEPYNTVFNEDVPGEIDELYEMIEFNGNKYFLSGSTVSADGVKILDKGINVSGKSIEADVYKVAEIKEKCVIALKKDEVMYVYNNDEYKPETLAELIEDYGLDESLVFSQICGSDKGEEKYYYEYEHLIIYKNLSYESEKKNRIEIVKVSDKRIIIMAKYPSNNVSNLLFYIDMNGYAYVEIFGSQMYFDVGKDVYNNMFEYLESNN